MMRSFEREHIEEKEQNDFAVALYGQLLQRPGNLFFSPFSIRTAVGMAYAGARGETAVQMRRALRVGSSDEGLHAAFAEIIHRLSAAGEYEMAVANSLWAQDGAPLQTEFLDLVARHYGGGMNTADFRCGADAARVRINRWVEERTKERIRGVIPPGMLDADTRLVLVNAVYFKGMWAPQFPEAATRDKPFYLEGDRKVLTPLMHGQQEVGYLQADGYQAVKLDYRGGDLSMLVLLPDKTDGLRELETRLSGSMLHDCVANMLWRKVRLFLPRFRLTWGVVEMGAYLCELGMPLAFTRFQADFSGINGHRPPHEDSLFISAICHKAFVEVNEKGTEAAAVTGGRWVRLGRPEQPIPIFQADHPFLFAIRDGKSGAILFLGRMADPTRES